MVDRSARDLLADSIEALMSGEISNFEYEKKVPDSGDLAVSAIAESVWCLYDDFKEHDLQSPEKLPEALKHRVVRWTVFLRTDFEYEWPMISYPGIRPLEKGLLDKLISSRAEKEEEFMKSGDYSVWPFIDSESYGTSSKE